MPQSLSSAVFEGNIAQVQQILGTSIDINKKDEGFEHLPLILAIYGSSLKHDEILKLLLNHSDIDLGRNGEPENSPLAHAVKADNFAAIEILLLTRKKDIGIRAIEYSQQLANELNNPNSAFIQRYLNDLGSLSLVPKYSLPQEFSLTMLLHAHSKKILTVLTISAIVLAFFQPIAAIAVTGVAIVSWGLFQKNKKFAHSSDMKMEKEPQNGSSSSVPIDINSSGTAHHYERPVILST